MNDIFISYRRDDGGFGRNLYEKLLDWYDAGQVFFDHENIDPGEKFSDALETAIAGCTVFLAVIGPQWLSEENQARLQDPDDITRGEIRSALQHGKAIIPVLAGGAGFPKRSMLPEDIWEMQEANAHEQAEKYYRASFQKLLDTLKTRHKLEGAYRRRDGNPQPFHTGGQYPSPHFADPTAKLPKLHQVLAGGGRAALTAATVQGMGGVGKTLLALQYSHAFRDEYQGVWWLRAEDSLLLEQDCEELCRAQAIPRHDNEAHSRSVARWLKTQPAPWLLVYDNADDPQKIRPYLPETGGHHALFTSRNPNWGGIIKAEQQIDLQTWGDDEALEFLQSRLDGISDNDGITDNDGRRLSHALGGLPLALEMAAAYLERNGLDVTGYLAALADVEEIPRLLDGETPATGYPHSVFAALSLAFDKLTPAARELLEMCVWFAPEPIPERMFLEHPDKLPEALKQAAAKPNRWRETVGELKRYALCRVVEIAALDASPGEGRKEMALLLHRLTQEALRAKFADKAATCAGAVALLGGAYPSDATHPDHWPVCAALLPHVRRLWDFYPQGWVEARPLCWLLDRAAIYLQYGPALYREAEEMFRAALEIRRKTLSAEHPDTLTNMNNLTVTLSAQGDLPGARALLEQVVKISHRVLGTEHPDTLSSTNNLAETLRMQGDLSGARALLEPVVEISRRVLGAEHPDTLNSISNLALTLYSQDDLPGARALEEQVLAIRRRVLGAEHSDTLTSISNLAATLSSQGDLTGARALEEQVLAIRRRVLGAEHPDTLNSINNLAATLRSQGDMPGACALLKPALEICRRVLGAEHPGTSVSAFNLFMTLRQSEGEGERALETFRDHLAWLLHRDPDSLGADQRTILEQLLRLVPPRSHAPRGNAVAARRAK